MQILTVLLEAIFGEENSNTLRPTPYQLVKIYKVVTGSSIKINPSTQMEYKDKKKDSGCDGNKI